MHDELSSYGVSSYPPMKAQRLLAENIAALLRERGQKQKDLAAWCRHSEVWISAILSGKRSAHLKDLDRIADFFGIATYQLFQPGISRFTERRKGVERRTGHDRRVGHAFRIMGDVASDIESARKRLNEKRGSVTDKKKRA